MGELRLSHCCRLCLKEGFSLTNIFSQRSAAGDPLYQILNFIYEMKIFENDGLPCQICSPCMWRMIEFDACKKNVRSAEVEIMRLLSQMRPDECSEVEVAIEQGPINSEVVPIKEEIDIVEWEMPAATVIKVPVVTQHFQEADNDDYNDTESDNLVQTNEIEIEESQMHKELKGETMDFEILPGIDINVKQEESERINAEVGTIQSTVSSDSKISLSLEDSEESVLNSLEGESICTTEDNSFVIKVANKALTEEVSRDEVVPEEESLSVELSESILNDTESELSHLKPPLSKQMSRFICDICKKRFEAKQNLGNHVRVHNDERPFSCNVCKKSFKQDNVRYVHELRHLRDEMSFGKSKKGSKKNLFSCSVCAKNFSSKYVLSVHSNLHSDKYKCNICGKCFKGNNHLSRHVRIHTQEKSFKCKVCSKCFSQKYNLNRHLLIHSSERSFSCDTCDKRFKTKSEKTIHALYHLRKQ